MHGNSVPIVKVSKGMVLQKLLIKMFVYLFVWFDACYIMLCIEESIRCHFHTRQKLMKNTISVDRNTDDEHTTQVLSSQSNLTC